MTKIPLLDRFELTQRLLLDEGEDGDVPNGPTEEADQGVEHPIVVGHRRRNVVVVENQNVGRVVALKSE